MRKKLSVRKCYENDIILNFRGIFRRKVTLGYVFIEKRSNFNDKSLYEILYLFSNVHRYILEYIM